MIRLFVPDALTAGARLTLAVGQAHYLRDVMRRKAGDVVALFNGRDGEWRATLVEAGKRAVVLEAETRTRPQVAGPDLELIVALVKRPRLEAIVEKAAELGAARVRLTITSFTQSERINVARLAAIALEAAEQTGRLDVPMIDPAAKLNGLLTDWPGDRPLIFCDESGSAAPISSALQARRERAAKAAILIGPEGGFSADERAQIRAVPGVIPVSLGPRILRADTAAIAAMSLWQAALGDWRP